MIRCPTDDTMCYECPHNKECNEEVIEEEKRINERIVEIQEKL